MERSDAKKICWIAAAAAVGAVLWNAPLGMESAAQRCLALSVAAVVLWASRALDSGVAALALLAGYALCLDRAVVPLETVFGQWTKPTMYLVVSGFLIAEAVKLSGLGERIALRFLARFARSYGSVIISCYVLSFLLSFLIPHPWPRAFLLMSIMSRATEDARLDRVHAAGVGLAVFAGSVPTAAILITGDSTLNAAVGSFAGVSLSWLDWVKWLGVPAIGASAMTCAIQMALLGKAPEFSLSRDDLRRRADGLGRMKGRELWTLAVLCVTLAAWTLDSLHGIDAAWIGVAAVAALSVPGVGSLNGQSWKSVSLSTLIFLCAALAVGSVGKASGMNAWIARTLVPAGVPHSPLLFALCAWAFCTLLHMFLGSCLAAMGIAVPAVLALAEAAAFPVLPAVIICYFAITLHWIMPFHHINILVGVGDVGGYTSADAARLGIFQTAVSFSAVVGALLWWNLTGLM
ncbi:MAG: SLC13 family permease [Pyramidobacter sp.]|nr:SLC13 family permease [Pyramidobacter sp.]